MNIRIARTGDLEQLTEIYNQAIKAGGKTADTEPFTAKERSEWLRNHPEKTHPVYVAEKGGSILGYLSISPYRPGRTALRYTAEVSYYVHFDHHRKGVGSELMKHALTNCGKLGIKNLFAILLETNTASIKLLEKYGFSKWAHLPLVASFDGVEVGQFYFGKRIVD